MHSYELLLVAQESTFGHCVLFGHWVIEFLDDCSHYNHVIVTFCRRSVSPSSVSQSVTFCTVAKWYVVKRRRRYWIIG